MATELIDHLLKLLQKAEPYNPVQDNCDEDIKMKMHTCDPECISLYRLVNVMKEYRVSDDIPDDVNCSQIISDYLHLLNLHNSSDEEFEFIFNKFGFCEIEKCQIFGRNNRDRMKDRTFTDHKKVIAQQIFDKIHCFYCHCFDVGNKINTKQKQKINQIINMDHDDHDILSADSKIKEITNHIRNLWINKNKKIKTRYQRFMQFNTQNIDEENKESQPKMYSFGYGFNYDAHNPLHSSLKDELLNNTIFQIIPDQFMIEYKKAILKYQSIYNKTHIRMSLDCILVSMFYCNYDGLQQEFTKTYREIYDNETREEVNKRHCNYYWFGKLLEKAVVEYGMNIQSGHINCFYHGIGERLTFPDGVFFQFFGPTSTSSSFEVAVNFTNHNNGMVVEIRDDDYMESAQCLSVNWLSDYGNESEYLFIGGNKGWLRMMNLIDVRSGIQYKHILKSLRTINGEYREYISSDDQSICVKVLSHFLSSKLSEYEECCSLTNNQYAQNMVHRYFENKKSININWNNLGFVAEFFFDLFYYSEYEWIKLKELNILFPNIQTVGVQHINLCSQTLDAILNYLSNHKTTIKEITMYNFKENCSLSYQTAASKYVQQFKCQNWDIVVNKRPGTSTTLILKSMGYSKQ